MSKTVVVYGPQGCGKTTNGHALALHFGCDRVVDDWVSAMPLIEGALHLKQGPKFGAEDLPSTAFVVAWYPYDNAMRVMRTAQAGFDAPPPSPGGAGTNHVIKGVPAPSTARDEGAAHYRAMQVQPWDVIDTWPLEQRIGFYRGNLLKYTMRMGAKDVAQAEIEKAAHYARKLQEVLSGPR